jgi:hypothetical protein
VARFPALPLQYQVMDSAQTILITGWGQTRPSASNCIKKAKKKRKAEAFSARRRASIASSASHQCATRCRRRQYRAATRGYMQQRFGCDFTHVRVHTDAHAERSAQAVSARAYTLGTEVVFAAGQYSPYTAEGRRLLAHELAHVVQQQGRSDAPSVMPVIRRKADERCGHPPRCCTRHSRVTTMTCATSPRRPIGRR